MILTGKNRKAEELEDKPVPVPLFPPNSTCTFLGANPGLRGEKPATNRLSYDIFG
jgi:hypothetical protein